MADMTTQPKPSVLPIFGRFTEDGQKLMDTPAAGGVQVVRLSDALKAIEAQGDAEREELLKLRALINNPQTAEFLPAVQAEAAHQRQKWGEPHDRQKSAENWFWLVGYLSGKALRAAITGDTFKAKHHTISSAAALCNWFEAIGKDESGTGLGVDDDIKPSSEGGREGSVPIAAITAKDAK